MRSRTYVILKIALIFFLISLLFASFWMFRRFSVVSLSQTVTILLLDLGAHALPGEQARSFLEWAFILPAAITASLCTSTYLERRHKSIAALLVLGLLIPLEIVFIAKVNFDLFARRPAIASKMGNIFDQYQTPVFPELARAKPLNVIWIFVESLEASYTDPSINAELQNATGFMTPLTVGPIVNPYTVGGVMSAKCGAPIAFSPALVVTLHFSGFIHASCFDDVLRRYGYHSYFVVGHDASLSGFRRYYRQHAAADIYDQRYLEFRDTPKNSRFDAYPDERVFQTANEILQSPELKEPYILNVLTLDNHAPSGYPSRYCESHFGTTMPDVIRCDNHFLAQFINQLHNSGQLNNTVLVVMGDHPFMGTFSQVMPDRKIFAKIYTPLAGKQVLNPNPAPFDFFPSVLSSMGFNVGTRRYGFGYSFYDVANYPVSDWKDWLTTFSSVEPTPRYWALSQ